jgi:hypothetical protein
MRIHFVHRKEAGESDIRLMNESGEVVVELSGLRYKNLESAEDALHTNPAGWLYKTEWEKAGLSAENKANRNSQPSTWLIFTDDQGVGDSLASLLEEKGETCALISPGERYEASEEGRRYRIDPKRPDDFIRLIGDIKKDSARPCRGIAHLWSLGIAQPDQTTCATLDEAQTLGFGSAVSLIQAVVISEWRVSPRLWFVTQMAQSVSETDEVEFGQSPVWGLARVVMREHPEIWGGAVDLERGSAAGQAASLFADQRKRTRQLTAMASGWWFDSPAAIRLRPHRREH